MTREDILSRLKEAIEKLYNEDKAVELNRVEVINFELRDDSSLRVYVKVSFRGAWTILHGRINDIRDYEVDRYQRLGIDLTPEEQEFLEETGSQAPARVAPSTSASQYIMHLVGELGDVVGDGSELPCLTGALLSNPNLISLITHGSVELIALYVERVLGDLACDPRSGAAVSWVTSLLSNPSLMSIVDHQIYSDQKMEGVTNG